MRHLVDKGLVASLRIHYHLRFVGVFSHGVFVGEGKFCGFSQRFAEGDKEVGHLIPEDVGDGFGIGYDALHVRLIIYEGYFVDDSSEDALQQFNNFVSRIFII